MNMSTVKDLIENCTLEDLANDPAKLNAFADMLRAAKKAGFDPIRVEEIVNSTGKKCLEIVYQV